MRLKKKKKSQGGMNMELVLPPQGINCKAEGKL